MKILFNTDLHGSKWKYEKSLEIAVKESVDMVINGGDMLPTEGDLIYDQEIFLTWDLKKILNHFNDQKIYYLFIPGNNDLKTYDRTFEQYFNSMEYVKNIAMKSEKIKGYEFIGFNLIHDYPFPLKDRCRRDAENYTYPEQYSVQILSKNNGFQEFESEKKWQEYCQTLPTLQEELKNLIQPADFRKTIYVMHETPYGSGLDQLNNGKFVGSKAINDFILKNQPLLTLHGHVHASKENSCKIGETVCVQPGQLKNYHYVIIDLYSMKVQFKYATEEGKNVKKDYDKEWLL